MKECPAKVGDGDETWMTKSKTVLSLVQITLCSQITGKQRHTCWCQIILQPSVIIKCKANATICGITVTDNVSWLMKMMRGCQNWIILVFKPIWAGYAESKNMENEVCITRWEKPESCNVKAQAPKATGAFVNVSAQSQQTPGINARLI